MGPRVFPSGKWSNDQHLTNRATGCQAIERLVQLVEAHPLAQEAILALVFYSGAQLCSRSNKWPLVLRPTGQRRSHGTG
jgi:hypothetical protein